MVVVRFVVGSSADIWRSIGCDLESAANHPCQALERDPLERLCRYVAPPAVSNERLSVNDSGHVVYRLKFAIRFDRR